ncbi:MAG TPA: outer membrane protein assembly factor BamC, partial [Kineobactrum sp.]
SAEGRITLEESPQGYAYIRLGLPFTRAWASLAKALEDSLFEITDRDRSTGIYYVRFLGSDEESERGWFSSLFGGGDDDNPLIGRSFLVTLTAEDERTVNIRLAAPEEAGQALEKRDEQSLLALIKGNIN